MPFVFESKLPVKLGFAESIDGQGNPCYIKTPTEIAKKNDANELRELKNQLAQSDDAAIALFEAQANTADAILALYEKVEGGTIV